jgi:hypothetical protein
MDLIDQIGGWKSASSIGNSYGQGYKMVQLQKKFEAVQIPTPSGKGQWQHVQVARVYKRMAA